MFLISQRHPVGDIHFLGPNQGSATESVLVSLRHSKNNQHGPPTTDPYWSGYRRLPLPSTRAERLSQGSAQDAWHFVLPH